MNDSVEILVWVKLQSCRFSQVFHAGVKTRGVAVGKLPRGDTQRVSHLHWLISTWCNLEWPEISILLRSYLDQTGFWVCLWKVVLIVDSCGKIQPTVGTTISEAEGLKLYKQDESGVQTSKEESRPTWTYSLPSFDGGCSWVTAFTSPGRWTVAWNCTPNKPFVPTLFSVKVFVTATKTAPLDKADISFCIVKESLPAAP